MTDVISPLNLQRRRTSTGSVGIIPVFRKEMFAPMVSGKSLSMGVIPLPTGHLECQDHLMLRDHHYYSFRPCADS